MAQVISMIRVCNMTAWNHAFRAVYTNAETDLIHVKDKVKHWKNYIKKYKSIAYLLNPHIYQCADTLSLTHVW